MSLQDIDGQIQVLSLVIQGDETGVLHVFILSPRIRNRFAK